MYRITATKRIAGRLVLLRLGELGEGDAVDLLFALRADGWEAIRSNDGPVPVRAVVIGGAPCGG